MNSSVKWRSSMGDNWYSDRRQDHVKLSPLGKCPIKWTDLLVVTIVTIINMVNDLTWITLQWNSSWRMASLSSNPVISWVLSSYFVCPTLIYWFWLPLWYLQTFLMGEICSYIWPKLKIRISYTHVKNSAYFILILLCSNQEQT